MTTSVCECILHNRYMCNIVMYAPYKPDVSGTLSVIFYITCFLHESFYM